MMNRRTFLSGLTLEALSAPLAAGAQSTAKISRVGVLYPSEPSPTDPNIVAFRQGLGDLRYVEGQNITVDYRYAHGRPDRFRHLIAELAGFRVDLIVVGSGPAALEAKSVTQTIPIVFVGAVDPVGVGLVMSLSHPGGHVTGLTFAYEDGFGGKWVELLKEVAPRVSHMAVLRYDPTTSPAAAWYWQDMRAAARALNLKLQPLVIQNPTQLGNAFARIVKTRGALIVDSSPGLSANARRIAHLAAGHRVPTRYPFRRYVDAGGLISYGVSLPDLWRRAATYVDKILKGAKPADLPVEQPTKFELIINLKTAKALGLTIPQSVLVRADELLQ